MSQQQEPTPSSTRESDTKELEYTAFRCQYETCLRKLWFTGFQTQQELDKHMQYHRCQWLIIDDDGSYSQCHTTPMTEQDSKEHLKCHQSRNNIPFRQQDVSRNNQRPEKKWFCPWQSCTSFAYCIKGAISRAHIQEHLRVHANSVKSDKGTKRRRSDDNDTEAVASANVHRSSVGSNEVLSPTANAGALESILDRPAVLGSLLLRAVATEESASSIHLAVKRPSADASCLSAILDDDNDHDVDSNGQP